MLSLLYSFDRGYNSKVRILFKRKLIIPYLRQILEICLPFIVENLHYVYDAYLLDILLVLFDKFVFDGNLLPKNNHFLLYIGMTQLTIHHLKYGFELIVEFLLLDSRIDNSQVDTLRKPFYGVFNKHCKELEVVVFDFLWIVIVIKDSIEGVFEGHLLPLLCKPVIVNLTIEFTLVLFKASIARLLWGFKNLLDVIFVEEKRWLPTTSNLCIALVNITLLLIRRSLEELLIWLEQFVLASSRSHCCCSC